MAGPLSSPPKHRSRHRLTSTKEGSEREQNLGYVLLNTPFLQGKFLFQPGARKHRETGLTRRNAAYELATGQPSYAGPLWTTFMNFRAQRIQNTHKISMNNRLDQLAAPWVDVQNLPQSTAQRQADAAYALAQIATMRAQIDTTVFYDRSGFV